MRVQRVQRVQKVQRVQRVAVAADATVFIKKGARLRRGLCSRVVFASLRGRWPFGPRVVVSPMGPQSGPGSEGSKGSARFQRAGSEGGGGMWTRLRREG